MTAPPPESWRRRSERVEAERFVARAEPLALVERWLGDDGPQRLLVVSGPAGVGKSALLRAVGRRAEVLGVPVVRLGGASAGEPADPIPDGAVVLVDDLDAADPSGAPPVPGAPAGAAPAVVVAAGRAVGEVRWDRALPGVVPRTVRLGPLDPASSRLLLARAGVDGATADEVVRWSDGWPLALVAAALHLTDPEAPGPPVAFDPVRPGGADDQVLACLVGDRLRSIDPAVLDVAAVAPVLDVEVLAVGAPGRRPRDDLDRLAALTTSETVGGRVALHPLVRAALGRRLAARSPARRRDLVLRLARLLRGRALAGDAAMLLEMVGLLEDPLVRVGIQPSSPCYADRLAVADLDALAERAGPDLAPVAARLRRWTAEAPELVVGVRAADGTPVAAAVVALVDQLPDWHQEDPAVGPVVDHLVARGTALDTCVLFHMLLAPVGVVDATPAELIQVGNNGGLARLPRLPRWVYATHRDDDPDEGMAFVGFEEVAELRRRDGAHELRTWAVDHGPGGMAARLHELILAEQGGGAEPRLLHRGAAVVDALRHYRDDDALLRSGLGEGSGRERVAAARAEIDAAIDAAFGDGEGDRLRRRALDLAYREPGSNGTRARNELYLSRSAYFRLLQRARDQLRDAVGR